MLNKRAQILFKEETWGKITQLAKKKGTSVADLVRRAVKQVYQDRLTTEEMIESGHQIIRQARKKHQNIDYKALIEDGRRY